jgi:hypothetical protein
VQGERGAGEELVATKRNGKTTLGGGPHQGMVGGGAVSVNAGAEEQPRSSATWTKGMGCLATQFEALKGQGEGGHTRKN